METENGILKDLIRVRGDHLGVIQLSEEFGSVFAVSIPLHKAAQQRIAEIGKRRGYRTCQDFRVSDRVRGRGGLIDVVWVTQHGITAAFEIRTKKLNLDVMRSIKDREKLDNLDAERKYLVNVSKISGTAYFHDVA